MRYRNNESEKGFVQGIGVTMGLSSSQARLLNLTTRMHQIEYKAAKLEAEKLQMANESTRAYEDYLEALEKTKIQKKKLETDGSITYVDIATYADLTAAGLKLKYSKDDTICNDWAAVQGKVPNITESATAITNLILSGDFVIVDTNHNNAETSVATNTGLREVTDDSLLKKAEASYEANMRKIDMKDRKFDQDLAALDAERNAIKQEMETLKSVAKENVDRTFKLFS